MTYQPPPCPVCGAWAKVLETRRHKNGVIKRRIECANLHRFTDYGRQPARPEQPPPAKPEQAAPIETTVAKAIARAPALHTIWMK